MSGPTKNELIFLLETQRKINRENRRRMDHIISEAQNDADEIERLKTELRIAEMTIARMATDETIRKNMEGE